MAEKVAFVNGSYGNWPLEVTDFTKKSTNADTAGFAAGIAGTNNVVYVRFTDDFGCEHVFRTSKTGADALRDALNEVSDAPLVEDTGGV